MRRITLLLSTAALSLAVFSGAALANESANSAMQCGGTGLNPGQAFHLLSLVGGPAAGPDKLQTPPEFAARMGADSVGALLQRDCQQVK